MTEKQLDRVLDWANKQRTKYKIGKPLKRLPKGDIGQADSCVLARALGNHNIEVGYTRVQLDERFGTQTKKETVYDWEANEYVEQDVKEPIKFKVPKFIKKFIETFDAEELPHLIRKN